MICQHCESKYEHSDQMHRGFCSRTCQNRFDQMTVNEQSLDWFGLRLRAWLIRETWPAAERDKRARPEWRRRDAEMKRFSADSLETLA